MGLLIPKNTNNEQTKFNGIRRTPDGMLYLTSIDPNVDSDSIQYSNYFEPGKSDTVPKDGSDYVEERLELFNLQYFTGDGSTLTFTLNATGMTAEGLAVFFDGVRKTAYNDYSVSGTTLTFVLKPANNSSITVDRDEFISLDKTFNSSSKSSRSKILKVSAEISEILEKFSSEDKKEILKLL